APDRESGAYTLAFPGIIGRKIAADQLHDHSVGIAQAQDRFAEFLHRPFGRHMIAQGAFQPETDGSSIYSQCNFTNLSMTDAAPGAILPNQKRDKRSGCAGTVPIEQVELLGILESTRLLDDAQPQKAD